MFLNFEDIKKQLLDINILKPEKEPNKNNKNFFLIFPNPQIATEEFVLLSKFSLSRKPPEKSQQPRPSPTSKMLTVKLLESNPDYRNLVTILTNIASKHKESTKKLPEANMFRIEEVETSVVKMAEIEIFRKIETEKSAPKEREIKIAAEAAPQLTEEMFVKIDEKLRETYGIKNLLNIAQSLLRIFSDPFLVAKYLKPLDSELGQSEVVKRITNILPGYLIEGTGIYVPGSPPTDYVPHKKYRLLNEILLRKENCVGVNKAGFAAKFIGFVNKFFSDQFVSEGNLFAEDTQIGRLLLHGKEIHRLNFEIIRQAESQGDINLHGMSHQELLKFLVSSTVKYNEVEISLWSLILDFDEKAISEQHVFNCRSPLILNSLITCFGHNMGLENLQKYMLDSHYKAALQHIDRFSKSDLARKHGFKPSYDLCMISLAHAEEAGILDSYLPSVLTEDEALKSMKYDSINRYEEINKSV